MPKTRPFLKWAGNKYRCMEQILQALPKATRLIEPFAGSASVFLNSNYSNYLIAEGNQDLINLFKQLKEDGERFIQDCQQLFTERNNNASMYYQFRDEFNTSSDRRRKSLLFLYLNRHGYNGLCRYNRKGIYNVPFGRYQNPYFPQKEMQAFYLKSRDAEFIHSDFRQTFQHAVRGDVIYCDPPYVPLEQASNFSSYTNNQFGEDEQIVLAQLATAAANRGITVIISNHDTDFTRHHYQASTIHSFLVRRSISCQMSSRAHVKELIAIFRD